MELVEGEAVIEDVGKFVARLDGIGDDFDCVVQAFDARYIVSRAHLERALELADRTRERGEAIAHDCGVEILLYAAGRRQIDRALECGVSEGRGPVVVLISANANAQSAGAERAAATAVAELLDSDATLGEYDEHRVREYFDIGERELRATDVGIENLVLERVALLDVEK